MHFILDVHCHTTASGHAYSTFEENLHRAKSIGLKLIGVSDHGPAMIDSSPLSHFLEILKLPPLIGGVHCLKGAEANIINTSGGLDIPDDILSSLDFCIASIHESLYLPGDSNANTDAILAAMQNPYVSIIGHPGDINVPINPLPIVANAAKTGTLIEINNKSLIKGNRRYDGGIVITEILALCKEYNTGIIAGSDAHMAKDVGRFKFAKSIILKSGIDENLIMNTNVERFLYTLKGKRYGKKS